MNGLLALERVPIGSADIQVSPLGLGAWAWGDRFYWGYGRDYAENDTRDAFETALAAGVNFFDTAETYGRGQSERLLGEYDRESGKSLVVATKFMPYPWRFTKSQLLSALRGSLDRLGFSRVDLYQIHSPYSTASIETLMEGMTQASIQNLPDLKIRIPVSRGPGTSRSEE